MSDIDPFEHPPVYEGEQVATISDLIGIRNGFAIQYYQTPWWSVVAKYKWRAAIGTIDSIIKWIEEGKKDD